MSKRKVRILEEKFHFGRHTIVLILYNKITEASEALTRLYNVPIGANELEGDVKGFVKVGEDIVCMALRNDWTWEIFCHEHFHLTHSIHQNVNVRFNAKTEENYALLHETLFSVIIGMMKKDKVKLPPI